jgi:hypothetical protein
VVYHDVLGLPGSVEGNRDDDADVLTADLSGVVVEEAVVANRACEFELLVLLQLLGGDHD